MLAIYAAGERGAREAARARAAVVVVDAFRASTTISHAPKSPSARTAPPGGSSASATKRISTSASPRTPCRSFLVLWEKPSSADDSRNLATVWPEGQTVEPKKYSPKIFLTGTWRAFTLKLGMADQTLQGSVAKPPRKGGAKDDHNHHS